MCARLALRSFVLRTLGVALALAFLAGCATSPSIEGRARALEERLIAPCCGVQTLDVHDSPSARELRAEILERLRRGEPSERIEDDLAARYGEQIRAVPRGSDPRELTGASLVAGLLLSLLALTIAARGWTRRATTRRASVPERASPRDALDDRLDEELAALDD
ncbi:MAG: cytochrome c-type biogenesis protein CcmH [Sandaracinus sp.]